MKSARQIGMAGLVAFIFGLPVSGCRHAPTTQLAPAQAPSITKPQTTAPPAGNPLSTQSPPPLPSLPAAAEDASAHAPKAPTKVRHLHRKPKPVTLVANGTPPSTAAQTSPATAASQGVTGVSGASAAVAAPAAGQATPATTDPPAPGSQTAINLTPAVSPAPSSSIGLLSAGDTSGGEDTRRSTVSLIASTETGLNTLKRSLSTPDQQTAGQIRTFLQKAKAALDVDDLDGAHTLATKAKVLLDELTKQ
ncbi:MAG TPA: hypothetical protein VGD59_08815 [Acidisarcina sp.]